MPNAALRKTELEAVVPVRPSSPIPQRRTIDLGKEINAFKMGLIPQITGLNFIVWLHRALPGSNLFIEATPDSFYEHKDRIVAFLEPEFIETSGKMSIIETERFRQFAWDNMDVIEEYWFSSITAIAANGRIKPVGILRR